MMPDSQEGIIPAGAGDTPKQEPRTDAELQPIESINTGIFQLQSDVAMLTKRVDRLEERLRSHNMRHLFVTAVKIFVLILPFVGLAIGFFLMWLYRMI